MATVNPDLNSIFIVLAFLGALIAVRQIIVAKAGTIKAKLGTSEREIVLLDAYKLERSLQVSLLNIGGSRVAVLHGARGQAAIIKLEDGASVDLNTLKGEHADAP
ncbi:hypothetical protein PM03_09635 [Thalassobacter stenotrophicus]|uniref:hypothetical protein n=1 Tax=Thalassobacter TaxID=266808 RepID=UPI00051D6CD2|nr:MULTISPECIES: hypothetical protein [Thalassobacter]KGK79731.1 hypothetical protein PM03_09635 [Thalassobacter stenotrophicus]KGL01681.1 hypothetical protein PM04_07725 [Thalassobacter sp. 16PALIMAR09]